MRRHDRPSVALHDAKIRLREVERRIASMSKAMAKIKYHAQRMPLHREFVLLLEARDRAEALVKQLTERLVEDGTTA